jgi:DNA-binding beta-propeller fold protein YncE
MKRLLSLLMTAACVAAGVRLGAQAIRDIAYDANVDALQLPSGIILGEVAGVATNSRGQLFVYTRSGHAVATLGDERTFYHGGSRLFQFDQNGRFVKEIGQGTYAMNFAQQARVDPQDNLWVVDAGSNMLMKFDPEGRLLMVLGRKPESINVRSGPGVAARVLDGSAPAANEGGRGGGGGGGRGNAAPGAGIPGDSFNRPSDVTWDRSGNIFVADGFGTNNRIAKFTRDGNFVKSWGSTGSSQGQFNTIRGLVADSAGNIYVADAGNNRIQVFDGEGAFKSQITGVGSPQAICISGGSTQYLYSSNSNDSESMENGEIYKLQLNGQIVGRFGKAGKLPREFGIVNALDCRTENDLWVGEIWNWRAQKVTLKR